MEAISHPLITLENIAFLCADDLLNFEFRQFEWLIHSLKVGENTIFLNLHGRVLSNNFKRKWKQFPTTLSQLCLCNSTF